MPDIPQKDIARRSKDYSIQGYILSLAELVYLLVFLLLFQGLGFSARLAKFSTSITFHNSLSLLIYLFWLTIIYYLVGFPLFLYHSFIRERRFGLSGQKLSAWLKDQLKSLFIMYLVAGISLEVFYYFLRLTPVYWWLIVSFFWILLNLLMARIAPQVIIPLFFKCSKLEHGVLRERIVKLAAKMGVKIVDVFEIDFSKKTYKANAAFVGLGSSQKVLLADTLKEKFSDYEVEVIVAHEFAHYLRGHLLKLIVINSCTAIVCFYLIYRTSFWFFSFYNLASLQDISGIPLLFIYFTLFGVFMQPLGNFISRVFEREADLLAIQSTGFRDEFISGMNKLAGQNLADRNPHPWIKFFFYDHPPVDERINMAKSL